MSKDCLEANCLVVEIYCGGIDTGTGIGIDLTGILGDAWRDLL